MCVNNKKEEGERERWEIRDESNLSVSGGVDVERRWLEEGGFVGVCALRRRIGEGRDIKGDEPAWSVLCFLQYKQGTSISLRLSIPETL